MVSEKTRRLGEMPIFKLLVKMSIPSIVSMVVQALYNMVDSIFVGMVSLNSLQALSYAFPVQVFTMSFCLGIGIASNSIVSRRLGEKKYDEASTTAQNAMFLTLMMAAFFAVFAYPLTYAYLSLVIPKDNVAVFHLAMQYTTIYVACSFGVYFQMAISRILQATGNASVPMTSQLIGAIVNIILDPIFILVLKLDVVGAVIATIIGEACSLLFVLYVLKTQQHQVTFFNRTFKPSWKHIKEIILIGLPVAILNSIFSITVTILNKALSVIEHAVTILGIYYKLNSLAFMPLFGINQGAMPIMGYNFGANLKKRFVKSFVYALLLGLFFTIFSFTLFQTIPGEFLKLFSVDKSNATDTNALMEMGKQALRIASFCFIPAGFSVIATALFQAIGKGFTSMILSLLRQLIILVPMALLLMKGFNLGAKGVWLSIPISELITTLIFIPITLISSKKAFNKHELILQQEAKTDV